MNKKKIIRRSIAGVLGAGLITCGVLITVFSISSTKAYNKAASLYSTIYSYEAGADSAYKTPGTPDYTIYNSVKTECVADNTYFAQQSAPLPYLAAGAFVCLGGLVYMGVQTLSDPNRRKKD